MLFDHGTISFKFLFDIDESVFALRIFHHDNETNMKFTIGTKGINVKKYYMGTKDVIITIPYAFEVNLFYYNFRLNNGMRFS